MNTLILKLSASVLTAVLTLSTTAFGTEEAAEPFTGTPGNPARRSSRAAPSSQGWETELPDCLPSAWSHPLFGPAITNIKQFDLDPYWVDSRHPIFKEVYEEVEPCFPTPPCRSGYLIRQLNKACVVTRYPEGRLTRYNVCSWYTGWIGAGSGLGMLGYGIKLYQTAELGSKAWLTGCILMDSGCGVATVSIGLLGSACALAKINSVPRNGGCLDCLRPPEGALH